MGFLQRLFGGGKSAGKQQGDQFGHYVYVRCKRCRAVVRARIDMRNDLSPDEEGGGRMVRKMLVDERCFRPIETVLRFGRGNQLVEQTIEGGEFIDEEAYNEARAAQPGGPR